MLLPLSTPQREAVPVEGGPALVADSEAVVLVSDLPVDAPTAQGLPDSVAAVRSLAFFRNQAKGVFRRVGPAPLQKCVGDFCCINFGGFCRGFSWRIFLGTFSHKSASPKPHPSKPHLCNMPQAKNGSCAAVFGMLRCRSCTAAFAFLQCRCHFDLLSCAAASAKLQCNIEKAALQESGAFLPLSCGFQAPTFRHPRLGPAEQK